jgi:ABC-2 type transport system ATP-binding protein
MITANNLIKKFGSLVAVEIDYLNISKGEILGLVGNNGAGKTTLLRLLLDLLKPECGEVLSKTQKIIQSDHWKGYTGSYIDTNYLIDFLTPKEYFEFVGSLYNMKIAETDQRLNDFESFMNGEILSKKKLIRNLSSGNKHKVGIIGALISKPELIVLDEPFNFIDPGSQIVLKQLLRNLHYEGNCTMIISSHNLNYISDMCNRIILLDKGRMLMDLCNTEDAIKKIEDYFYTSALQRGRKI